MRLKIGIGIVISGIFVYLAFRQVNLQEMRDALLHANYFWILPALLAMLLSHYIRAFRWGIIFQPIQTIRVHPLFSALMIGYAANNIFPLRLGEFLRAYAIGKSQRVSKSAAFATVIVDRLADLLSLLSLLAVAVFVTPLPEDIKNFGWIIFVLTVSIIVLMVFLMEKTDTTIAVLQKILPARLFEVFHKIVRSFLEGFAVFRRSRHAGSMMASSAGIWILYMAMVYCAFEAFDFPERYGLNFFSSLVVLVIVSIGIMIPSSPGFIGTYHWFCIKSLAIFSIPKSEALSFAVISHALNVLPVTVIGLIYFWKENLRFADAVSEKEKVEQQEKVSQELPPS